MSNQIEFTEPALFHYNYDLSKAWFIYFDVTNPLTGQKLRKQIRHNINKATSKAARIKEANVLLKFWKGVLHKGEFNPFTESTISTEDLPATLLDALNKVYELKIKPLKEESVRTYKNIKSLFVKWLTLKGYEKIQLQHFTADRAQAYLDYLLLDKDYGGKTHNNHLSIVGGFFNVMKKRWPSLVKVNPFADLEMLPTDIGRNTAYTEKEQRALVAHFKEHNVRMYYLIQFTFHCFLRKTEFKKLMVGDIDWINGTIRISSASSKNRNQDAVTIPEGLFPILYEMGLDKAEKDYYIFGYKFQTCAKALYSQNAISDAHLEGKIKAGQRKDDGKGFYSWKHTGVVSYWNLLKDPYSLMRQCRHSNLQTTMIYLKSLGLSVNLPFKGANITL